MKDQEILEPALYMVSTPIGNLEDLSPRAGRILRMAGWVAAEDTRESRKLLESQGIKQKLISFHEHSLKDRLEELVSRLKSGESVAYISDAGTPGLCDPGAALVASAAVAGIKVVPVPGPSALAALLSVSGFSESEFRFLGFFPREKKAREEWAENAAGQQLFFESPHRIKECLRFLATRFPQAAVVIGRELTKKFETLYRGSAAELAGIIESEEPRGEYAVAVLLPEKEKAGVDAGKVAALLKELRALGAGQKILTRVAVAFGMPKNEAYQKALEALGK